MKRDDLDYKLLFEYSTAHALKRLFWLEVKIFYSRNKTFVPMFYLGNEIWVRVRMIELHPSSLNE